MSQLFHRRVWLFAVVILVGALLLGWIIRPQIASATPPAPLIAAWEQARAAGAYHFTSDVIQITVPVAKVTNVGHTSRTEQLHLKGQTDLRAKRLEMQLWSNGGSVLQSAGGVAIKVENGKTFTRQGTGDWQEAAGFADTLAPQGDFLAYLHAMRDVQAHEPETRGPSGREVAFTRYSFTIDGPAFAAYMRDQMVAALQARGKLPPGMKLSANDYYQQMTGTGELWVGDNGLPLRQILNLNFPEQHEATVHAQIVVDFSHFGTPQLSPLALLQRGDLSGLLALLPDALPALTPLGLLFPMLICVVLLLYYRRSRPVYTGLVTAIILSMVVGPLLTTFQVDSFLAAQAAQAAKKKEQQASANTVHEASVDLGRPEFNPQVNPLELASDAIRNPQHGIQSAESGNLSVTQSPNLQTTDPGTNSDSDTLTDFVERRVGTDPNNPDTDVDGVKDDAELQGYNLGGQSWYGDPRELDSNNDGLADGQEWSNDGNSQPDDSDGDSLPDFFDPDNDNDGVSDRQDLSPFSQGAATYGDASPLRLTLNNLTAGKPTLVDFQVRPTDPNRLWYAFNVLDWPNDSAGQVQDVDDKTYADRAATEGRAALPSEANGDMQLIPMLEIRLPTAGANLPPQSDLIPYNISINKLTADGSQQIAYVPLTIVTAEQTGQRVGFSARMKYLPTGSWPAAHEIRLAWVLQALVDQPCDVTNPQDVAAGCVNGYIRNTPQVIQSYYDDWTLTGLNVSEQHGAKTALIYEDPAVDNNLNDDYPLSALTYGLDQSFLAGRDADNNQQRDVDLNEIARRFDRDTNGTLSSNDRWGLDGALNILQVERHDYATFDQAAIFTAMTDTVQALTHFDTKWAANNALKPTIAFAYEQASRSVGLDAVRTGTGYLSQSGASLTVDMQGSSQPAPLDTMVGLKWTHYCRAASASSWSPCAGEVYWAELEQRYGNLALSDDPPGAAIAAGSNGLMQVYDLALSSGVNGLVQSNGTPVTDPFPFENDTQIADSLRRFAGAGGAAFKFLANQVVKSYYVNSTQLKTEMAEILTNLNQGGSTRNLARQIKNLPTNSGRTTRLAVGGSVAIIGLAIAVYAVDQALANEREGRLALRTAIGTVQIFASGIMPIYTTVKLLTSGTSAARLLTAGSELLGLSRTANVIGAVVGVAIVWGFFAYTVIKENISPNSIEFGALVAQAIATTIYIIVLALISATAVGLLLVGLVTVIDAILTLICEFGGGSCFTIGGTVIKALADAFYTYGLFIDTERNDLVQPGAPQTTLVDPSKGFVGGNDLRITMPITTHIVQKKPNSNIIDGYSWLLGDSLRATTFRYSLTQPNEQDVPNAGRGTMSGEWQNIHLAEQGDNYVLLGAYANSTPTPVDGFNLQPGLNRAAPFYLNMGYALPAYSCWRVYIPWYKYPFYKAVPNCGAKTIDGKNSSLISALRYDIFPNTLGSFLTLATKADGGRGLNWDAAFPSLKDADGDGLRASLHGGLDPDDSTIDKDNDGLTDSYELEQRAAGQPYSPIQCDSDNDGLTDGQESQFNSNPALADSDNDGLKDGEEVWHRAYNPTTCVATSNWSGGWSVTINASTPFPVRVSSDPTSNDTDGDGVSDLAEKQLATQLDSQDRPYHPTVFNTPPLAVYTATDKRFVAPGQNLIYTTTVVANQPMAPGVLGVVAPAPFGALQPTYALNFNPSATGSQTVTHPTALTAQSGLNSQNVALQSNVQVRLALSGPPTWTWDPIAGNTIGSYTSPILPAWSAAAASSASQEDRYRLAVLASDNAFNTGSNGNIQTFSLPDGLSSLVQESSPGGARMGSRPPSVACNNAGICMVAFGFRDQLINVVTGPTGEFVDQARAYIYNADGQFVNGVIITPNITASPGGFYHYEFNPRVASDGTNFLVALEATNENSATRITYLVFKRYNAQGQEIGTERSFVVVNPRLANHTGVSTIAMNLIRVRDRYRLAWGYLDSNINITELDDNGVIIGPNFTQVSNQGNNTTTGPVPYGLAYNPVLDRTLLLYQRRVGSAVGPFIAALFQGSSLAPTETQLSAQGFSPGAAYDPRSGGWLITTSDQLNRTFALWNADFTVEVLPALSSTTYRSDPTAVALACPAPTSQPVLDLRFEELPSATTFVDSSGEGNNATCFNCPAAATPGAVDGSGNAIGTPASDYAISFNGDFAQGIFIPTPVQNQFTFTFWYKSPASTDQNGLRLADTGGSGAFLSLSIFNPYTELTSGSTTLRANRNLNDGAWHFVAATRDDATGRLEIYIDGDPTPAATVATSDRPFPRDPLLLRSARPANIDNFRVYAQPLSGATLQAIYNRTQQSYCLGTGLNRDTNQLQWFRLNATQGDPRGGKITASNGLTVTIDADKPTSAIGGLANNQYIRGNTTHTIGGNASDATAGVTTVEVNINNGGWQPASGNESWAYNLAVTTGNYTIQTRATDAVGNVETPGSGITVRADGTVPDVTFAAPASAPLKPTRNASGVWVATLSGTASDSESGVQTVQVLLQGQGNAVGNGWQTATRNGNNWSIDYAFPSALVDPTGSYTVSVRAADNVGNQSADNAATGLLHLDTTGPAVAFSTLDAARLLITDTVTISGLITDTGRAGIDKLEMAFVPVEKIAALPANATPAQADAQLARTWLPVTVAQRGAGVIQSNWSIQIPATLENEYQIDLRATDMLGSVVQTTELWRGVIDTLAPRVALTGTGGAMTWFDPNIGAQVYNLDFTCTATDRYLNEPTFTCPAGGAPPVRTFDTDPVLQALFPDRTIMTGLSVHANYPWGSPNPTLTIRACDIYGHCTQRDQTLTPVTPTGAVAGAQADAATMRSAEALVTASAVAAAPLALVVAPAMGSYVAADGNLAVTIAAEASAVLKEVTILLDSTVVQTLSFAQSENVIRTLRTVSLSGVGEGQHTLVARATDWANATQATDTPITFTLDRQAPTVTIDPATLTDADTWAVGSNVLRFNGNATDSIGLAAVQIKEGNGGFVDATFGSGLWQTALPVTDPEGRTLAITVRAIDRAGRISEATQTIGTDLSTPTAPDTTISSTPTNPSVTTSATFEFSGSASAVAFECQLDGAAYAACISPWTLLDLSKGSHLFRVRAIDSSGNVDLTPAEFTWSVNASALDATITSSPANPSNSRDASFTFSGTGNAFDCALDDAAFAPCSSPQNYSSLPYGDHTFQVRSRNGSAVGAAARFTWNIVNTAPVANSQTVDTNKNVAVAVTLTATDSDPLTYQVSQPAHGILLGTAPALTYSPDSGFVGTDSFTFVANDGQLASNVATVTINVATNNTDSTPPAITPQVTGTAGSNGWYVSDVNLTWNVVDPESPITSQTGCDPATVNTETAGQAFTCSATSGGGTATQSLTIKLDKTAPDTTITAQPANPSTVATAAFQFSGTDNLSGPAGFECSLDNSAFAACTSPQNYSNLAEGSHTFQVRTVDAAGIADTAPASYTWTVQTLTVVATCGPITVYRNPQGQLVAPGWVGTIRLGTAANNTINGAAGPDLILGLGGNDALDGKAGDDLICGGDGIDLLTGAAGNDTLDGGAGNDVLNSGVGDFDSLSGGEGNDVLLDGDGVISALGGPGNDAFTLALRNGWRDRNGQPRFTGLAAGYGNDAVGLAILNPVRFYLDITGDERDEPASPLEGTTDGLVLAGLIDPASVIIKFERRAGVANRGIDSEPSVDFTDFFVDPTTLTDASGATFLTEPVGGDTAVEEGEQAVETRVQLYLPLISAATK